MKEITIPIEQIAAAKQPAKPRREKWKIILLLSVTAACLLAAAGLIIILLAYLDAVERREWMNRVGTFLVLFAAPLYFLAAHCLDKLDFRKNK